jgi:hypothetical protein
MIRPELIPGAAVVQGEESLADRHSQDQPQDFQLKGTYCAICPANWFTALTS